MRLEYEEIEGNLITLAKQGVFDVIAHGCNCFCRMKRGIAPQMAEAFGCDKFLLEGESYIGDISKLGNIDYEPIYITSSGEVLHPKHIKHVNTKSVIVVNCYTQYQWSTETKPFDYDAFTLCMKKMNHIFKGKHIGLPQIGSHLAGGNWDIIKEIIFKQLIDCRVTVVIYKPE